MTWDLATAAMTGSNSTETDQIETSVSSHLDTIGSTWAASLASGNLVVRVSAHDEMAQGCEAIVDVTAGADAQREQLTHRVGPRVTPAGQSHPRGERPVERLQLGQISRQALQRDRAHSAVVRAWC